MKAFGLADEDAKAAMLDVPTPEAGPGEVRVKVVASSVNGWDVFVAAGMARGSMEHRYPVVCGKDYAGTIDSVGEGVTRFAVGDEVLGIVPGAPFLSSGSYAEYLVVPDEGFIEHKPGNLDFGRAGSLGLAALTAFHSVEAIEPSNGDVVLVVGAAGGVGSYAVQLAAARGATVIATARPEDQAWIRALGASEAVDYSSDVATAVRSAHPDGVDGLIAAVHLGDMFGPTAELVKDGGRIASTVGGADAETLASEGSAPRTSWVRQTPRPSRTWSAWPRPARSRYPSRERSRSTSFPKPSAWSESGARAGSSLSGSRAKSSAGWTRLAGRRGYPYGCSCCSRVVRASRNFNRSAPLISTFPVGTFRYHLWSRYEYSTSTSSPPRRPLMSAATSFIRANPSFAIARSYTISVSFLPDHSPPA